MIAARPVQAPEAPASGSQAPGTPTPEAIEREVLDNVEHQRLGTGTVEDLAMPEDFLRRVADRVIRASFEERYRMVVKEEARPAPRPPAVVIATGAVLVAALVWFLLARVRR